MGGVGIMNIMLVSVTERTREIGIAKALGAPRSFILMQFLIEAMVLAVIGGIIGIGFGWLLGVLAAKMIPHFPPPAVPWWAVVGRHGFLRAGRHDVRHPAGAPGRQPGAHRRVAPRVIRASAREVRTPKSHFKKGGQRRFSFERERPDSCLAAGGLLHQGRLQR